MKSLIRILIATLSVVLTFSGQTWADQSDDAKNQKRKAILCDREFASVSEAMDQLMQNPTTYQIPSDDLYNSYETNFQEIRELWTFTTENNAAHPAVVCRKIIETNGNIQISTTAHCQAERKACDAMMLEFQQLDNELRDQIQDDMRNNSN